MSKSDSDQLPDLSGEEALRILLVALRDDPHRPTGCLTLILHCRTTVSESSPEGRPDSSPELSACFMRFLTVHRTREDRKLLRRTLGTCRCAAGPPPLPDTPHKNDPFNYEDFHAIVEPAIDFMANSVGNALQNKKKLSRLYREPNRDENWPRVWEELFPYDPSTSVHALSAWRRPGGSKFYRARPIIQFLTSAFEACLLKGLLKSPLVLDLLIDTKRDWEEDGDLDPNRYGTGPAPPEQVLYGLHDIHQAALTLENVVNSMFDDELYASHAISRWNHRCYGPSCLVTVSDLRR
jgi:hypothetical protein